MARVTKKAKITADLRAIYKKVLLVKYTLSLKLIAIIGQAGFDSGLLGSLLEPVHVGVLGVERGIEQLVVLQIDPLEIVASRIDNCFNGHERIMFNTNLILTPIACSVVPISAFYFLLSNNITVLATRDHINIKRRA